MGRTARLVITGLSDDQIKALPDWDSKPGFRELDDTEATRIQVAR